MRSLTLLVSVLLIAQTAPAAAGIADLQNAIGLYTEIPGDLDEARQLTVYEGNTGTFTVFAVLTNPYNENTGGSINVVGGYEFRLELPSSVILLGATLPAASINFVNLPDFSVGTSIPVSGDGALLATLTLGEFTGTGGQVLLAPVSAYAPSIPGSLAVTDAEDDFSLSPAVPSSGNLDSPVFCVFCRQYDKESTWGGIKTLFR